MNGSRIGLSAAAAVIGAGVTYLAVASGQGVVSTRGGNIDRFEYGTIIINDRSAVLNTANRTTWLELNPPYSLDATVYQRNTIRFRADYNPVLTALNHFGGEGWEVDVGQDLRPGRQISVRRQR